MKTLAAVLPWCSGAVFAAAALIEAWAFLRADRFRYGPARRRRKAADVAVAGTGAVAVAAVMMMFASWLARTTSGPWRSDLDYLESDAFTRESAFELLGVVMALAGVLALAAALQTRDDAEDQEHEALVRAGKADGRLPKGAGR